MIGHITDERGEKTIEDLTVFIGSPAFNEPMHVGRPNLGELQDILQRINTIMYNKCLYPGSHQMDPYRSHFPHAGLLLPEIKRKAGWMLRLPAVTSVREEEMQRSCHITYRVVASGDKGSRRLKATVIDRKAWKR